MINYVQKQVDGNAILYSIYKDMKEELRIDESRKHNNVAARAAYCKVMRESKSFTFEQIGAVLGKNHATPIYLIKKASWGTYKNNATYHAALRFCANSLNDYNGKTKVVVNVPTTKRQEIRLINALRRDKAELNVLHNKELERAEMLLKRLKTIDKCWKGLERGVKESDSRMRSLGFHLIDREQLEKLEKNLKI